MVPMLLWSIGSVLFPAPARCLWLILVMRVKIDMYHFLHLPHYHKACHLPGRRLTIGLMHIENNLHSIQGRGPISRRDYNHHSRLATIIWDLTPNTMI
jgi:hypothetical protein